MRDRLRITDKKYKNAKLKTADNYWKFCFGNDIPFQSPLSSLETDDQQQIQNPLPTMAKMITLTQVKFIKLAFFISYIEFFSLNYMNYYNMKLIG
jgi:hypothetical protein